MTFQRLVISSVAALTLLVSAFSSSQVRAQDAFDPFSVFVIQDQSHTRCGPGEDFYRTDPLNHGQQLEVYAETENGWLGVRPPEGSFCWLPEDAVSNDPGGQTGTVTEDKTVAWIGTQLGRASKYRWQVQLGKGETVSIIGRSEREGPEGPQTWLRIVPPSGEFRWIHRDEVVLSSEELVAMVEDPGDGSDREFFPDGPTNISEKSKVKRPARVASFGKRREQTSASPRATERIRESGQSVLDDAASSRRPTSVREGSMREEAMARQKAQTSEDLESSVDLAQLDRQPQSEKRKLLTPRSIGQAQELPPAADTAAAPKTGLLAFLSRPRISEPGSGTTDDKPRATGGWFAKSLPRIGPPQAIGPPQVMAPASPLTESRIPPNPFAASPRVDDSRLLPESAIARTTPPPSTLSGTPAMPAQTLTPISSLPPLDPPARPEPRIVASQTMQRLRGEAATANADHLNLMLSRLMATQATSIEIQTIAEAASASLARGREPAAMAELRTRAQSMADVSRRREGVAPIVEQGSPATANIASRTLPAPSAFSNQPLGNQPLGPASLASASLPSGQSLGTISVAGGSPTAPPATNAGIANGQPVESTVSGQLVKVYGPNPSAPPYAITDSAGRTLCYVTPIPGVNLTTHLNSVVTVRGLQGYVAGMSMPHLRADSVIRR